jgi:UDP-N-acetylglucosamine--N-acetylmuramyl-(pentapeptide) pyrophosphoryl-undecaprenol N-acetylglucosamine transferase
MAESTLIVSRAGAMSAAEIGAAGRPAVFVPLNIARAHQLENVLPLEQAGAAQVVIQDENLEENLFLALKRLLIEDKILEGMAMSARSIKNRFNTANEFVVCLESL